MPKGLHFLRQTRRKNRTTTSSDQLRNSLSCSVLACEEFPTAHECHQVFPFSLSVLDLFCTGQKRKGILIHPPPPPKVKRPDRGMPIISRIMNRSHVVRTTSWGEAGSIKRTSQYGYKCAQGDRGGRVPKKQKRSTRHTAPAHFDKTTNGPADDARCGRRRRHGHQYPVERKKKRPAPKREKVQDQALASEGDRHNLFQEANHLKFQARSRELGACCPYCVDVAFSRPCRPQGEAARRRKKIYDAKAADGGPTTKEGHEAILDDN